MSMRNLRICIFISFVALWILFTVPFPTNNSANDLWYIANSIYEMIQPP